MQKSAVIFSLFVTTVASAALAQEAPYSQTLDEQLQRVQSGQPAVPYVGQQHSGASPSQPQAQSAAPAAGGNMMSAAMPVAPDGERIDSIGGGAIPPLPLELQTAPSGVQYLTGGIGDEELAQLKSVEANYNLQLLIASKKGLYMSGLNLRLLNDKDSELVATGGVGPYFYTLLHPGTYKVEVTSAQGVTQTAKVTVPTQGATKPVIRFAE
jgi:hypothetical protein